MEPSGPLHKRLLWQLRADWLRFARMSRAKTLYLYLNESRRARIAAAGGILPRVAQAAKTAGWQVCLKDENDPVGGDGYHLVYNQAVTEPFSLCLRRCHMDPFFRIEQTNDRWDWEIAAKTFTPRPAFSEEEGFRKRWRNKLFDHAEIVQQGYIFMPLQGKLLSRRHFQTASPIEMIHQTLAADPSRHILATLHPNETYSHAERAALDAIGGRFKIADQPSLQVLARCDYVVTQNSSMALTGFFAEKPAVLFAKIDFHHIAASVPALGVDAAFRAIKSAEKTPFAAYLHWFFKRNAITSWADDAVDQIRQRFREHGWPM